MGNNLMSDTRELDCVIIGAGPAGLTAAIYLARFRRKVSVIDSNKSRLSLIPLSHNYPGFPAGVKGHDLIDRLRAQLDAYDIQTRYGTVTKIENQSNGTFHVEIGNIKLSAKTVLLCTGSSDVVPPMQNYQSALAQGTLRYCPVCDGFEATDKTVAVLGDGIHGADEAKFIRHFTPNLSLITLHPETPVPDHEQAVLQQMGIQMLNGARSRFEFDPALPGITAHLADGSTHCFDIMYSALGLHVNSELATALGARCDSEGQLCVDEHMQSTVKGLYCAGDVVVGLNQISVSSGQAAVASTAIHNHLRETNA